MQAQQHCRRRAATAARVYQWLGCHHHASTACACSLPAPNRHGTATMPPMSARPRSARAGRRSRGRKRRRLCASRMARVRALGERQGGGHGLPTQSVGVEDLTEVRASFYVGKFDGWEGPVEGVGQGEGVGSNEMLGRAGGKYGWCGEHGCWLAVSKGLDPSDGAVERWCCCAPMSGVQTTACGGLCRRPGHTVFCGCSEPSSLCWGKTIFCGSFYCGSIFCGCLNHLPCAGGIRFSVLVFLWFDFLWWL